MPLRSADAYVIGFWIEHTKHTIIEAEKVRGEDGVVDCLKYLLKLLTKHKLVRRLRSELRDQIKLFTRKYHGKQRLGSEDHDEIISLLVRVDDGISTEIEENKSKKEKRTKIRLADSAKERVYGTGQSYDVYKDLREIVENARSEIFVIDSYANEELIDLYLSKTSANDVPIRALLKEPKDNFLAVAKKFLAQKRGTFEVRENQNVHDRIFFVDNHCYVIGQSVKDAGKKPTYLIRVNDYANFRKIFDELWAKGRQILPMQV